VKEGYLRGWKYPEKREPVKSMAERHDPARYTKRNGFGARLCIYVRAGLLVHTETTNTSGVQGLVLSYMETTHISGVKRAAKNCSLG
jgi:hypothetical protein